MAAVGEAEFGGNLPHCGIAGGDAVFDELEPVVIYVLSVAELEIPFEIRAEIIGRDVEVMGDLADLDSRGVIDMLMDIRDHLFFIRLSPVDADLHGFHRLADESEDGEDLKIDEGGAVHQGLTFIIGDDVVDAISEDDPRCLVEGQFDLFEQHEAHDLFGRHGEVVIAFAAEIAVGELNEDESCAIGDLEIVFILGRDEEEVAGLVGQAVAVEDMVSVAAIDIDHFIVGMAVGGQVIDFFFEVVEEQGFELSSFHLINLQHYSRIVL